MPLKWCPGHRCFHDSALFGRNKAKPDGFSVHCRAWNAKVQAKWKKEHPEAVHSYRMTHANHD